MSNLAYWYCPHCKEEIDPTNVTFQELHDTCGHTVEWIEGIDLDRLEEICAAERDGRCVVRPCKVGDVVNTRYGKGKVVAWDTTARVKILDEPDLIKRYRDFDIGSKVFVCAEAEAAMNAQNEIQEPLFAITKDVNGNFSIDIVAQGGE